MVTTSLVWPDLGQVGSSKNKNGFNSNSNHLLIEYNES